jgi:phospholipase A1
MKHDGKKNHYGVLGAGMCLVAFLGFSACYGTAVATETAPDKAAVQDCLLKALENAPGGMTVDELRIRCKAEKMAAAKDQKDAGIIEARIYTDDENVLRPFTLMAHKPNYILLANYNADPNNEP